MQGKDPLLLRWHGSLELACIPYNLLRHNDHDSALVNDLPCAAVRRMIYLTGCVYRHLPLHPVGQLSGLFQCFFSVENPNNFFNRKIVNFAMRN